MCCKASGKTQAHEPFFLLRNVEAAHVFAVLHIGNDAGEHPGELVFPFRGVTLGAAGAVLDIGIYGGVEEFVIRGKQPGL